MPEMWSKLTLTLLLLAVPAAACGGSSATTAPTPESLPPVDTALDDARRLATDICRERGLSDGFAGPADLAVDAAALEEVSAEMLHGLVFAQCPEAFFTALSPDELAWCGSGRQLSPNYFNVIEAGLALELPVFVDTVDPSLLSRATDRTAELEDEEVTEFAASLQAMAAAPGFDRDWAAACRTTF